MLNNMKSLKAIKQNNYKREKLINIVLESAKIGLVAKNLLMVILLYYFIFFYYLATSKDKKNCLCHVGVFDFGHTGNTVSDALGNYNTKKSVLI
jgi:uncharacterized membrane protein YqhA